MTELLGVLLLVLLAILIYDALRWLRKRRQINKWYSTIWEEDDNDDTSGPLA